MSEPGVGQLRVRTRAVGRDVSAGWRRLVGLDRGRERGQILALFGLSLVVIMAGVGLVVDAGSTYAQRRDQQTATDLAALAAANDYLINHTDATAIDRARAMTAQNGYVHGVGGVTVDVTIDTTVGVQVSVAIDAPHANTFLPIVGMPTWDVTTSAASLAGFPDSAYAAAPFIFSIGAFEDDGTPKYQTERGFGDTNNHAPTSPTDFAWTNFGTGNVNTSQVRDIIEGSEIIEETLEYGEYIGQHNNGNHTALFNDVDTYLSGKDLPVAVVDDNGNFMGWAMFHVSSASGGSTKQIRGYFLSSFASGNLRTTACEFNACPRYLGSYVLKLSD
jgi:Flp pilus assembly protein TadG